MSENTMGVALRHLGGEGPIEVMTRAMDFNIQQVVGPDGRAMEIPANTLITFSVTRFRELGIDTDVWEFATLAPSPTGGPPITKNIYLLGKDVLLVRANSRIV